MEQHVNVKICLLMRQMFAETVVIIDAAYKETALKKKVSFRVMFKNTKAHHKGCVIVI